MNDDLIIRSALLDRINYYIAHSIEPEQYAYKVARTEVEIAPAVDAVPVVRCGECKWSSACKPNGYYLGKNGFCSRGEPIKNELNDKNGL